MKPRLRVLHLEDNSRDAELIRSTLEDGGFECDVVVVDNRKDFTTALTQGQFDIILSDFGLGDYDGLAALEFSRKTQPDVPFILVSGTLGEDEAVESLKSGATDYILKGRLIRLAPAVQRALDDAKKRAELKEAEAVGKYRRASQRHRARPEQHSGADHDVGSDVALGSETGGSREDIGFD
jgi:DNA-binding NtrC family response regulator